MAGVDLARGPFERLVDDALDGVPDELATLARNVVVLVADDPPTHAPDLLGLYEGVPLTERDSSYTFREPDRITVFSRPLLAMCADEAELVEQVRITVVHEIAHHFGIDDDRLRELGYG
ncbi:metallopeptidase family protein [Nocardioides mangrovicus]|uniref:Metallopeptidase family protein n=1 Tax=Nocardioides mangrovicus TaxID=2478913 RepID=A0A3L8NZM1_9ACTN|nr:metallopeptidase family protein [Nocardioides mangrovicus]RLV47749.1 metallopeptidase family protein [Nocardioides mangrovicus]